MLNQLLISEGICFSIGGLLTIAVLSWLREWQQRKQVNQELNESQTKLKESWQNCNQELTTLKYEFERETQLNNNLRKELEAVKQELHNQYQHNPVPTYTWEGDECNCYLINYNFAAQKVHPQIKLGQTPQQLFRENHQVVQIILRCLRQKTSLEHIVNTVAYQGKFIAPNQVILYNLEINQNSQSISEYSELEQICLLLKRAINASSNGVVIVDAIARDYPIIYVNSGFEQITGYSALEVIGQNCRFLQNQERNQAAIPQLKQAIETGQECHVTLRNYRKDGSYFWNQLHISPVYNSKGRVTHFIGIQTDVTEAKKTEEQLLLTQYSLERVRECIFWLYADGSIFYVNQTTCDVLGYTKEELLELKAWDISLDCSPQLWPEHWQELAQEKNFTFESRHRTKTGEIIPVEVNVNYLEFNGLAYNFAVVRDLRERKQTEAERDRFFTLSLDLLCIVGFDGCFKRINPAFANFLGYKENEVFNQALVEFIHTEDQEATLQEVAKLSQGQKILSFENRYRCGDGSYRWIFWNAVPYLEEQLIYAVGHDITNRKKREIEIQETRQFLQTMIDHLPVAVFVKDGHPDKFGQMILWNKTCEKMFGVSAEQAIGKTVYDHFPPEQAQFFAEKDRQAFAQRVPEDIAEEPIDSLSLGQRLLHTIKIPLYDAQEQPQYLLCISEDITEKKQAETAFRNSQNQLNSILNSLRDIVWSVTFDDLEYIYINGGTEEIYGYSVADFLANPQLWGEAIHPEDRVAEVSQSLRHNNYSKDLEYRIIRPDGEIRWVRDRAQVIYDQQGQPIRIDGIVTDITTRKQIEDELRKSEEQFRLIFELSPMGLAIATAEGKLIKANQAFCEMLGYSETELCKRTCADITHPDDVEEEFTFYQQLIRGEISHYRMEKRYLTKQGQVIHAILQVILIRDVQGNLLNLIGQVVDISERLGIELALRDSEERLHRIISTISDGLLVVNDQGNIEFVNAAAEKLFGRSQQHLINNLFGIPFIDDQTTEICIPRTDHNLIIAEMRATQIFWEQKNAHLISLRNITERYEAQQAMEESEAKYRTIVETATEGIWLVDDDNKLTFVNQQMAQMLGYQVEEMLGKSIFDFIHPQDQVTARQYLRHFPSKTKPKYDLQFLCQEQTSLWAIVSVTPFYDGEGNYIGGLGMISDITQRKRIEQALYASEQRLESILNSIQDVVWSVSAHTLEVIYLNPATEKVYGRPIADFFQFSNLWVTIVHPEDQVLLARQLQFLRESGQAEYEYRIIRPDQEVRWVYSRAKVVYDQQGQPLRFDGIDTDITERKQFTEQLEYNAYHDPLTNLPNRTFLLQHLQQALEKNQQETEQTFAVLFLDLDDFKVVNDSLGHLAGDQLLKVIAQRLQNNLNSHQTLARFGGDEFTILVEDIQDVQEAIDIAEDIRHHLTYPYTLNNEQIFINTSIGIALSNSNYEHPQEILRDADTAMYRAKEQGKGCYAVFDQQMHQRAVNRLQLEVELRQALEREQFILYYQPIVSLITGYITGFEALIRWDHPERGMISPADFIPIAEETGLIIPMGKWILAQACNQIKTWQQQVNLNFPLKVGVNLSSKQLRDTTLIEEIDRILQETQLDYECLKLEITESLLMENVDIAMNLLMQLKERKIELSLDDFGTGYSSLSYLHRFPVSTVKIDRSFVMRMQPDNSNVEIIRAILTLAHTLDMKVIAEGIETELQLAQLKWLGCELGQGYFFAKPLHPNAALTLLQDFPQWL